MRKLRAAVVGVGYLGRYHAQKYLRYPGVELRAVVDIDPGRARRIAAEAGVQAYRDHRRLIGKVDLASVVVPTAAHFGVARDLLEAGIHVLMEKPMTATPGQGRALIELAAAKGLVLQVGHVERFNPVARALWERVDEPRYIESLRLAPFQPRGTDINVVLDLMIHDIDLILRLVHSPLQRIDASGAPVLSHQTDIANARLQFANGCVANVTASRVSPKAVRRMHLFQRDAWLTADFGHQTLDIYRGQQGNGENALAMTGERLELAPGDALEQEIRAFVDSVRRGEPAAVSGDEGLRALETAMDVMHQVELHPLPGLQREQMMAAWGWQL